MVLSSEDQIKDRETNNLLKGNEELKCDELLVITKDYEDKQKIKGETIKFIPAWKWLLEEPPLYKN